MEVERIVDPAFDVNLYLVKSEEALLLDSGTGLQPDVIAQGITSRLAEVPLRHIVLTHRHVDHVGGAHALSDAFGLVPQISVDDAPPLVDGDLRSMGANLFGLRVEPQKVDVIQYNQTIDIGGASLRAIHTPGHTVGGISLLGDDGSIFTGDTAFSYGGIGRWDLDTGSFPQLLSSLKMLNDLDVKDLYPGHGPPIHGEASSHLHLALEMAEAYGL